MNLRILLALTALTIVSGGYGPRGITEDLTVRADQVETINRVKMLLADDPAGEQGEISLSSQGSADEVSNNNQGADNRAE
jgi:hypothetical protein